MNINAKRPTHCEIGIGLHNFYRKIMRIDELLYVAPTNPGLNANRFFAGAECYYLVHTAHIDVLASRTCGLPTHTKPSTTDRNRALGIPDYSAQFIG